MVGEKGTETQVGSQTVADLGLQFHSPDSNNLFTISLCFLMQIICQKLIQ